MATATARMDYRTARAFLEALEASSPERAAHVQGILDAAEREREWADDYYNSNEDSPLADYVAGAGYGGEMAHEIEDRVRENRDEWSEGAIAWLQAQLAAPRLGDLLDFTSLRTAGIYVVADELCSAAVGECEHECSEELVQSLGALSDEERAAICELAGVNWTVWGSGRPSAHMYVGDSYTRWVLTLDVERVEEHLAELAADAADAE